MMHGGSDELRAADLAVFDQVGWWGCMGTSSS
jgi:hypothetical protein